MKGRILIGLAPPEAVKSPVDFAEPYSFAMTTPMYLDQKKQRERRDLWFQKVRGQAFEIFNPDGTPRIPQFGSSYREPLWMACTLYTGSQEHIDLINRVIARWHDAPVDDNPLQLSGRHPSEFDIFRSPAMTHLFHRFRDRISPGAERVMRVHIEHGVRTFYGAGQPDTKFHGANDNMPMMATLGLIFAGEILGDEGAVQQGVWNLNQFRLLLSRGAWASEYNASTYTAVTLSTVAQIATYARDPEVRQLALEIEHRLWAEVLLHFHPSTFLQAGPQARAYAIDYCGHSHSLQFLLWLVFGPEVSGRDLIRSYFNPDGIEVLHFQGCPLQSIAEYCHMGDTEFHVPVDLAALATQRNYPARLRGRGEMMGAYDQRSTACHTQTYMEEEFSLGSVNVPFFSGGQTTSLYATYKRKSAVADFRDASTVYFNYLQSNRSYGLMEKSDCGQYEGEKFIGSEGWFYTLQKDNVGLLVASPTLGANAAETDTLRLDVVFPAHYGRIQRTLIGDAPIAEGGVGESKEVVPISIEAGEVYIHIWPLLPTNLPRQAALRFVEHNDRYQVLQLVNYEGPSRTFSRGQLAHALNGLVFTIDAKKKYASFEEFHRLKSDARIVDYFCLNHRYVEFQRPDVWFDLAYTPKNPSAQTEAVDGRPVPQPVFESNQIDVTKLPFVTGPVEPNFPMFRWNDSLEVRWMPNESWMIGSRGLPEERQYSRRIDKIKES